MIVGQNIVLGPLDRRHADRTRAWMNDPELSVLLGRARPVTDIEHEHWLAGAAQRDYCAFFAIHLREDREHIGNVWLWNIEPRHGKAELRIVVGREGQMRKGLGTEAIQLTCGYAFDCLNLRKIIAYVLDTNPRARRAFAKAGFIQEAVLRADRWSQGRYVDVHLLSRFREEAAANVP